MTLSADMQALRDLFWGKVMDSWLGRQEMRAAFASIGLAAD